MRPVHPLREHRLDRGWSLGDVAKRLVAIGREADEDNLGVNGTMVGRWERGERHPGAPYPKLLCLLFQASASELGLWGSPHPATCGRLDDVERRTLLRLLAGALAAPMLGRGHADADRLASALTRPSRGGQSAASIVEAAIANARRLDDVSGSRVAVRPALAQRDVIRSLLEGGPLEPVKTRLAVAAADLSQLLGWLSFDMNDHDTARAYFNEGLQAAHEAGDKALGAYLLGNLAFLSIYEDRPQEALPFAEAARRRVEGTGSLAAQSWIATVEAEVFASLNDRDGTEESLDRARAGFARTKPEESPPWMYHYNQSGLESGVGTCYLRLGLAEPARQAMKQTLAGSDASVIRERSIYLARLGQTYVPAGEVDEACRFGGEALSIAADTRCDRAVLRVRKLRTQLEPWASEPMVRQLDDQLASTASWFRPVAV